VATTAAQVQSNINTFLSSVTVSGAGGLSVQGAGGLRIASVASGVQCLQADGYGHVSGTGLSCGGFGNFINNQSTLQSGATFYVSSGTVAGPLYLTGAGGILNTNGVLSNSIDVWNGSKNSFVALTNYAGSGASSLYINTSDVGIGTYPVSGQGVIMSTVTASSATFNNITINGTCTGSGCGGGSVVLPSSGIAFGSATNTVTSDTNTLVYNKTSYNLNLGSYPYTMPYYSESAHASSLNLWASDTGSGPSTPLHIYNLLGSTYTFFGAYIPTNGLPWGPPEPFFSGKLDTSGNTTFNTGEAIIGPTQPGNFIFQSGTYAPTMTIGPTSINASILSPSQFVKTDASKNLVSYDLLNSTQTWTGGNTFSSVTVTGQTLLATTNGNVGIGTTSPAAKLEVNGYALFDSSMTVTGVITSTAIYVSSATIGTDEYSNGTYVSISTIAWANSNFQRVTLTANTAFNFVAPPHAGTLTLHILTGSGSFACTWPGNVKWSGGTGPTITTAASKNDFCIFKYASDGNYYGSCAGTQNF
jgi:hypothetical protein